MRKSFVAGVLISAMAGSISLAVEPVRADSVVDVIGRAVADAREPSISGDGRWVVYGGLSGDRRSVFRTDRQTGATEELSVVPSGVRGGDTIRPRLSADGCVVVALTEIPFDLFRDDDRDDRWDVYRIVVPECGGQRNGWELVSAGRFDGVALDGVDTESAPTLSGSGTVIAFTHPVVGGPDGLTTISVVDVSIPASEPGRVTTVAGTPVEAPNRAYLYRGARQPAISQNGRHLAFVADFTASDPLPGWADGPELGRAATSQVYVWDRDLTDARNGVRLVSGLGGRRSVAGGDSPAISEDGRVVAFVSRDRALVPATLPDCVPDCPSQVYRFDRDVDGNGIFDEPPRSDPLTLVSGLDTRFGLPVAGDRSSWAPAISFDGSQIAFVTDATNLLPSHRGGGGAPTDGDLLVAEHHLGEIRRVIDAPSLSGVPGAHGSPALSRTGEVIAFDTMAAAPLVGVRRLTSGGGRSVAAAVATPRLSLAALDFGTVLPGFVSAELYATVLNAGPAAFEPSEVSVTSRFRITGGTCRRGVIVAAGQSCTVKLTFRPGGVARYRGTLTVAGDGPGSPEVSAEVRGAGGEPTLLADPGGVDLPPSVVGRRGGRVAIDISNVGFVPTRVVRLEVSGAHAADFVITEESCTRRALNADASCAVEVEFNPSGPGYRSALLLATSGGGSPSTNGAYTAAVIGGYARYEPLVGIEAESPRGSTVVSVVPGDEIGVTGSGFPADATATIGFDDGSAPFATGATGPDGSLLVAVRIPVRSRAGDRHLVVTSSDGAVATVGLRVEMRHRPIIGPGLPGYGLG